MATCKRRSHYSKKTELLMDTFHIIPESRGGSPDPPNTYGGCAWCHRDYHLFSDDENGQPRTPAEIIAWLVDYYWQGQWQHVKEALRNHKMS